MGLGLVRDGSECESIRPRPVFYIQIRSSPDGLKTLDANP